MDEKKVAKAANLKRAKFVQELLNDKNDAYRLIQNCILAGKYQTDKDNSAFWEETEKWLSNKLGV